MCSLGRGSRNNIRTEARCGGVVDIEVRGGAFEGDLIATCHLMGCTVGSLNGDTTTDLGQVNRSSVLGHSVIVGVGSAGTIFLVPGTTTAPALSTSAYRA